MILTQMEIWAAFRRQNQNGKKFLGYDQAIPEFFKNVVQKIRVDSSIDILNR
jgi:hypothetical protein